jgi:small-conductance mechanosensitive channel
MKFDLQDVALRTLILVAGGLAALLLVLKGQGQALPALAVGGTVGACVMARFGPTER